MYIFMPDLHKNKYPTYSANFKPVFSLVKDILGDNFLRFILNN